MTPAELKDARLALGLNQAQLGNKLGFRQEHISRMENGKMAITRCTDLAIETLINRQINALRKPK